LLLAAGRALDRGNPRHIHNRESTPPTVDSARGGTA
jgi:hypothetical protein